MMDVQVDPEMAHATLRKLVISLLNNYLNRYLKSMLSILHWKVSNYTTQKQLLISQDPFELSSEQKANFNQKKLKKFKIISHSEECSARNGKQDGSCASGFGVCCVCKYEN